jgi:hypothetical protein
MKRKTLLFVITEILYFLVLLGAWLVIWEVSGVNINEWGGLAIFVAVLILIFIRDIRDSLFNHIEGKYNGK